MATKEVLQSTCDRCGAEVTIEVNKVVGKGGKDKVLLPTGWLHVIGKSAFAPNVLALDLCVQCSTQLVNWSMPVEAREGE